MSSALMFKCYTLTHGHGYFSEVQFQKTNEIESSDEFHAHQHFFFVHLPPFHLLSDECTQNKTASGIWTYSQIQIPGKIEKLP